MRRCSPSNISKFKDAIKKEDLVNNVGLDKIDLLIKLAPQRTQILKL